MDRTELVGGAKMATALLRRGVALEGRRRCRLWCGWCEGPDSEDGLLLGRLRNQQRPKGVAKYITVEEGDHRFDWH